MDKRFSAIETAIAALIQSNNELRADFKSLKADFKSLNADFKSLKTTIIVTAIASVLAVGAINATVFSNTLAAFESGKDFSAKQAEVQKQVEEVRTMVKELREERERQGASRK